MCVECFFKYYDSFKRCLLQLLLQKTGDATPLVHAMRIGESHRDVAIVLLGAFSRWINHLDDDDIHKPATRVLLKALRRFCQFLLEFKP
jgi:hypothetical protein